jgi:acetyl esterase/lipase
VFWEGEERAIPLPAGVAVNSPWCDITHSSPSCETNANFDYLPPTSLQIKMEPKRPKCVAWPVDPPRAMMYADDEFVMHPLVSMILAPSWAGAPPIWMCTGRELLSDEDKFMANKFYKDGVHVVYEEYEGMPHCFALLFEQLAEARRCTAGWAGFAKAVVEEGKVKEGFTLIKAKTLKEVEVDPETLSPYTLEEIRERVEKRTAMGAEVGAGAPTAEVVAAKL